uniref:Uncharacterized protein n=1 Tax=Rhizophora mucronata TaxID=61149 RepID=A0A2P2NF62_RHIMU
MTAVQTIPDLPQKNSSS